MVFEWTQSCSWRKSNALKYWLFIYNKYVRKALIWIMSPRLYFVHPLSYIKDIPIKLVGQPLFLAIHPWVYIACFSYTHIYFYIYEQTGHKELESICTQHRPVRSPRNFSLAPKEWYRPILTENQRISSQGQAFAHTISDLNWKTEYHCATRINYHCWSSYWFMRALSWVCRDNSNTKNVYIIKT